MGKKKNVCLDPSSKMSTGPCSPASKESMCTLPVKKSAESSSTENPLSADDRASPKKKNRATSSSENNDEAQEENVAPNVAVPCTVTVGGTSSGEEARRIFRASCGAIESTYGPKECGGGRREWCLKFETESSATKAIFLRGMDLDTAGKRKLEVRRTTQKDMREAAEARKTRSTPLSALTER